MQLCSVSYLFPSSSNSLLRGASKVSAMFARIPQLCQLTFRASRHIWRGKSSSTLADSVGWSCTSPRKPILCLQNSWSLFLFGNVRCNWDEMFQCLFSFSHASSPFIWLKKVKIQSQDLRPVEMSSGIYASTNPSQQWSITIADWWPFRRRNTTSLKCTR